VSSPENPAFQVEQPGPDLPAGSPPAPSPYRENPAWTGWSLLAIVGVGLVSFVLFSSVVLAFAQIALYPQEGIKEIGLKHPMLSIVVQCLTYGMVFIFMVVLSRRNQQGFWKALPWNWPAHWGAYLFAGVALSIVLAVFEFVLRLPVPKNPPMDRFFQTARDAWIVVGFGTLVAPLMEELFFRGFLYPVLARRLGMYATIFITALGFGMIHFYEYGSSWGPVLIIFLVGIVLTTIRALTRSVAACILTHLAYNATLFSAMVAQTNGFRHLEKLG
jgi:membrane protease YdiL (CAAX protease family)